MSGAGLKNLLAAASGAAAIDQLLSERKCLVDHTGRWLSYGEVLSLIRSQARELKRHRGGVALVAPANDIASAVAILAAWSAGIAVALIDPAAELAARNAFVSAFKPEVTFTPQAGFIATGLSGEPVRPGTGILMSTSGTTGSSKFVRLPSEALFANANQIARVLAINERDIGICHLPLHYSYGLSVLLSHIESGAAAFLTDEKITSPDFGTKISAAGGTHLPGVPFHYTTIARMGLDRIVPPSVTTFTQAGGHLERRFRDTIYTQAQTRGARFYVMYGQTEAAPRMTTLPDHVFPAKPDSVGCALPGGKIEIVDENGNSLPPETVGRIVYRGPNVMWGYATSRACLTRGDDLNGRLETGDMGRLDDDGFLFIVGRNQRLAKIAGLRIGLDEIEQRLKPEFDVALLPDTESVRIYFAGPAGTTEALSQRVSALAGEYKIPARSFVLTPVAAIPLKASGKVDFARLNALA